MSDVFDTSQSRIEEVREFRVQGGVRRKRLTFRSELIIDDVALNLVKAEAHRVKTGSGKAPEINFKVRDYLLRASRWR